MFNQQILYAYSECFLDFAFLKSLIGKGYDVNSELFDGNGKLGLDIFHFIISSYFKNVKELTETIETLLDNGFAFKFRYNYWYLFLKKLNDLKSLSPEDKSIVVKTLVKMLKCGMRVSNVGVYYDTKVGTEKALLIDKLTGKYVKVRLSSNIFSLGITFDNLFNKEHLYYDREMIIEELTSHIEWLCAIKDKIIRPYFVPNNPVAWYEIVNNPTVYYFGK